jgi:hypothetical protein
MPRTINCITPKSSPYKYQNLSFLVWTVGELVYHPHIIVRSDDYQRENLRKKNSENRKPFYDKIICSIFKKIPLGTIVLARYKGSSEMEVVNGQQRYSQLKSFIIDNHPLYRSYPTLMTSRRFSQLNEAQKQTVMDFPLQVTIIDVESNDRMYIRDAYNDINSTLAMTPAEKRKAIFPQEFNKLISKISKDTQFQTVYAYKREADRGKSFDDIVRIFALSDIIMGEYMTPVKSMKKFLDDFASRQRDFVLLNPAKACTEYNNMFVSFFDTLDFVTETFGKDIFKIDGIFRPLDFVHLMAVFMVLSKQGSRYRKVLVNSSAQILANIATLRSVGHALNLDFNLSHSRYSSEKTLIARLNGIIKAVFSATGAVNSLVTSLAQLDYATIKEVRKAKRVRIAV